MLTPQNVLVCVCVCSVFVVVVVVFVNQGPVVCGVEEEGGEKAKLHTSLSSLICERRAPVTTPHATTHKKRKKGHAFRSTSRRRLKGEDKR